MSRNEFIDILRAFGIFAVLLIHTSANFTVLNFGFVQIVYAFIDSIANIAVPLFIFISGFVLAQKYYKSISLKAYYKKRLIRIIPLYLIFSFFYILFYNSWRWPNLGLQQVIELLLFGGSAFHLWYIPLLLQIYLLFPLFLIIFKLIPGKILLLLLFILQIIWLCYPFQTARFPTLYRDFFFSHIFYFFLGMFMSKQDYHTNFGKIKNFVYIMMILILSGVITYYWVNGTILFNGFYSISKSYLRLPTLLTVVLYSSVIIYLWLQRKYLLAKLNGYIKIKNFFLLIGRDAFEIYLIHLFFLLCIIKYVFMDNFTDVLFIPVTFGGTLVLSLITAEMIKKLESKIINNIFSWNKTKA